MLSVAAETVGPARTTATGPIRVASVPAQHVYVRHLGDPGRGDLVRRLPDERPEVPTPALGQWWPPAMLSAGWVREHHDEFDVFHIQFGFDAQDPAHLTTVLDELARFGKPVVFTVHDLRNPHQEQPDSHDAHLDVLIRRADELLTLTEGASRAVDARWGRRPLVVRHPHVVEFDRMRTPRPAHEGFVIGVHAKSLRASMAPLPVIDTVRRALADLPGARLVVDIHHDVYDRDGRRHEPDLVGPLQCLADRGEIELHVHDFYSDAELWDYLQGLDVSVLPYRFGTHSGWLEACFDLGTTVVAPDCGYFAEQQPCLVYGHDERGLDQASLQQAIRTAYYERPVWRADVDQRRRERAAIAAAHRAVYERLLA